MTVVFLGVEIDNLVFFKGLFLVDQEVYFRVRKFYGLVFLG